MWEFAVTEVEKLEEMISKAIRKRLGQSRCLSSVAFYGKGILELSAVTSLVEMK